MENSKEIKQERLDEYFGDGQNANDTVILDPSSSRLSNEKPLTVSCPVDIKPSQLELVGATLKTPPIPRRETDDAMTTGTTGNVDQPTCNPNVCEPTNQQGQGTKLVENEQRSSQNISSETRHFENLATDNVLPQANLPHRVEAAVPTTASCSASTRTIPGTILEDALFNLGLQKKKGVHAVRMLMSSFNILQKNISEILGLSEDDLECSNEPLGAMFNLNGIIPEMRQPSPPSPLPPPPPQSPPPSSIHEDAVSATAAEAEIQRLQSKLELLEQRTNESLKVLEANREMMLLEIKESNTTMSKLFAKLQQSNNCCCKPEQSPAKEKAKSEDGDEELLPSKCLQVKQDRADEMDDSLDLDDYEALIACQQPEIGTPTSSPEPCSEGGNSPCFTPSLNATFGLGSSLLLEASPMMTPAAPEPTKNENLSPPKSVVEVMKHQRDDTKPGFACKCGNLFKANGALWHHIVQQTPPRFKCNACGKLFHTNKEFSHHMSKEHNVIVEKGFTCYICSKIFPTRSEQLKHRSKCLVSCGENEGEQKAKKVRLG